MLHKLINQDFQAHDGAVAPKARILHTVSRRSILVQVTWRTIKTSDPKRSPLNQHQEV